MRRVFLIFFSALLLISFYCSTEVLSAKSDSVKTKEGWTFGALPVVAYDTDVGLQYGLLVDLYDYGDSLYPSYKHKLYLEWSRTTKGSGISRFYYDSEYLIPKVRFTADISYLTEQALNFYGFNGYEAVYNSSWEDEDSPEYKSRVYYRQERKMFRIMASLQGNILKTNDRLKWIAGFAYFNNKMGSVDIDRLNKGKDDADKLPDIPGLFDLYDSSGVLTRAEVYGNQITYLKGGLVYDSRDFEAFPTKGIWSEIVFSYAPEFLGDWVSSYSKLTFIHRQYFSIAPKNLVFAYRLAYQGTLSGEVPYHMQPHIVPIEMRTATSQGLGGKSTLRGILRNRVVGDGVVLGNFEVRWIFFRTTVFKQSLYLGTNLFFDAGMVVKEMKRDISGWNNSLYPIDEYFDPGAEELHMSAGLGLKVGLNENFVISVDYGQAIDSRDGDSGIYIKLYWLF